CTSSGAGLVHGCTGSPTSVILVPSHPRTNGLPRDSGRLGNPGHRPVSLDCLGRPRPQQVARLVKRAAQLTQLGPAFLVEVRAQLSLSRVTSRELAAWLRRLVQLVGRPHLTPLPVALALVGIQPVAVGLVLAQVG